MAFTADSKLGDILKEKPHAAELFQKYAGGASISPQMLQMAMGLSIRQVAGYAGLGQAKIDSIVAELNAL